MKESSENRCPDCDTPIPEASPGGLCPRCLLDGESTPLVPEEDDPAATLPIDPDNPPVRGEPSRQELLTPPSGAAEFALIPEELDRLFPDLEILKLLGAGGMGAVYQARQPRLDRIVALKVLSCAPEMHDSFALRFEREAQLLAKLHHPHIVTLFDFGEIPDGPGGRSVFYFLMEYIGGGSLEDRLRSGEEIRPRQAFRMISETCEALALAHGKGILHRDIKPANLLLDDEGRIRVADFGIAKILEDEEAPLMTGLTVTGTTMGTPHYMAPELWEDPTMVDMRADLYSVGVVFYQLLTGEKPAGVFEEPSRIADVERMVDDVVFKALEKNRERRYQDAEEMRVAVERVATRHRQRVKRKRAKAILALAGIAAVAGLAFWAWNGKEWSGEVASISMPRVEESEVVGKEEGRSSLSSVDPGILIGSGRYSQPGLGALDLSGAEGITDFVEVYLTANSWIGIREDGSLVSSDSGNDDPLPDWNYRNIGRGHVYEKTLIDTAGQLKIVGRVSDFGSSNPSDVDRIGVVDAQLGGGHALALLRDGTVRAWGSTYEGRELVKASGETEVSPPWTSPPINGLENVVDIAVGETYAAVLDRQGHLTLWNAMGHCSLPDSINGPVKAIASGLDRYLPLIDNAGNLQLVELDREGVPSGNTLDRGPAEMLRDNASGLLFRRPSGAWLILPQDGLLDEIKPKELAALHGLPAEAVSANWRQRTQGEEPAYLAIRPVEESRGSESSLFTHSETGRYQAKLLTGTNDSTLDHPDLTTLPRGRLRHAGTGPRGASGDFSQATYLDDFVAVAGSRDFWVGLRANGETVSSDGSLDASDIRKLCASFHTQAVLIDGNGQLHFREGNAQSLPESMEGNRFIDAKVSHRHGIALDESGQAHVFGEYYETDFDDGLGAAGYGTPKWPRPPEEALEDVKAIAIAHTHAATLKSDGSLSVFGWDGLVDLPPEVRSRTFTQIVSSPDQVCLLDSEGGAWRLGLARNSHENQPVGHAGKLLRMSKEFATAVGDDSWRDEKGNWHSIDKGVDELLRENLPGDVPQFTRKWHFSGEDNVSLLWVETVGATRLEPKVPSAEPGPLRGVVSENEGRIMPFKLEGLERNDDFVQLRSGTDASKMQIIGLRANGEVAGYQVPETWLDALNHGAPIRYLGYNDQQSMQHLVAIDRNGMPRPVVPSHKMHENLPTPKAELVDVRTAEGHGAMLTVDGRVYLWGDDFQEGGVSWPMPPDEFLTGVAEVCVTSQAIWIRRASGEIVGWGQGGKIEFPERIRSGVKAISVRGSDLNVLSIDGQLWPVHLKDDSVGSLDRSEALATGVVELKDLNLGLLVYKTADSKRWALGGPSREMFEPLFEAFPDVADYTRDAFHAAGHSSAQTTRRILIWITPSESEEDTRRPVQEIPPELESLRERGGRLREWTASGEEMIGLEFAEGIDDFVRLGGLAIPGTNRWLAIRRDGAAVTPLADFDRREELVSLNSHHGVLRSGELVSCYGDGQRKILPGTAIDSCYASGSGLQFQLTLDRDGTVSFRRGSSGFGEWSGEDFPRVREKLAEIDDATRIATHHGGGMLLRESGKVFAWNHEGPWPSKEDLSDVVDIAMGENYWVALHADGRVHVELPTGYIGSQMNPPTDLGPAYAIRVHARVAAAQMADGSWRAWGKDGLSPLVREIEAIGPAADIRFFASKEGDLDSLLWIEAMEAEDITTRSALEVPDELISLRERGGRLRSWAPLEDIIGLDLAEGIDDFVRLDGVLYPDSDRWLAVRADGPSVTPLPDFDRSGELVSLDTHLGVLRSGEIVNCYESSRKLLPGNAVDAGYAGHGIQFELFRNRDGTVTLNRAFPNGQWFENDAERILRNLGEVEDAVAIDTGPSSGIVLRRSGEIIAWSSEGLLPSDPQISQAVDVATTGNLWAAILADGSVHVEATNPDEVLPPEDLPRAFAIRAVGSVLAAQMADGSWRAWGERKQSGLIEQIHKIGPAVDLLFLNQRLLWIEPTTN